ncbi:MAG: hypothetical protein SVZ03_14620 [Spirochaetota bacterium]|nr:hypothetical protein [Spirochaetota bacterium]
MEINQLLGIGKAALKSYRYSRRAWKSPESLKRLQDNALQRAVSIAYHHTDFYLEKYNKYGIHPSEIKTIEDLPKLPIITKQELIDYFNAAVPRSLNKNKAFLMGTSGSTGQPLQVYKDYTWLAHSLGFGLRMLKLHRMGLPKAAFIFDINSMSSIENKTKNFYKYFTKRAMLIPVELDVVEIMERLEKANVHYIATYTGVMRELATLRKNGMGKKLKLKKVGLTGELLDEYTREYIEDAFDCYCYSSYISTEGGTIAIECENKKMHINSDYVMVEVVDQNGTPLPAGEDGSILLTCYDGGYGTPIIRYSGCSDVGQLLPDKCDCGLNTPIMGPIKGRSVDSIHLPDGRVYHAFSMTIPMEKIQREYSNERIRQYQIVQHELNKITISLIRNEEKNKEGDSLSDLMEIIQRAYQDQLGSEMDLKVQEVQELTKIENVGMPTPLVLSQIGKKEKQGIKEL